jgi:hypothetical protein
VASVFYLFDPKAWVKILKFSRCFRGNHGVVPNDKQRRDANCTYQLMILRVGRRKNIPRTYSRIQPRLGCEFDNLGGTMWIFGPRLSQYGGLIQTEKSAVLLDNITLVHLALSLRTPSSSLKSIYTPFV